MLIANNSEFVNFENANKKFNGGCSEIFVKDNLAIKRYYEDRYPKYFGRINKDVFETLKEIDNNAFIDLHDCFSKHALIDHHREEVVTGYTYSLVNSVDKLMIDMPMDYTLRTLYKFRLLLESLNGNHLVVRDAHATNVVKAEDNLVIIDPDAYYFDDKDYKDNLRMLNNYVSKLWFQEYGLYGLEDYKKIAELFKYKNEDLYLKEMYERLDEETPRELLDKVFKRKTRRLFIDK